MLLEFIDLETNALSLRRINSITIKERQYTLNNVVGVFAMDFK